MNRSYSKKRPSASGVVVKPKRVDRRRLRNRRHWLRMTRSIRQMYYRLLDLRTKPRIIARGLALGVFAGFFPFFGLQTAIGIFLAAIFRGSKIAAAAGTWISNPLTYLPIYIFNYQVGKVILGTEDTAALPLELESFKSFGHWGFAFGATLVTGCLAVGAIAAIITYVISLPILKRWHQRRNRRRFKRLNKRLKTNIQP